MLNSTLHFELFASPHAVAAAAAAHILSAATGAIADRGRFSLVLAGGRTPLAAYGLLLDQPAAWERWHCFFGDERCLPADHPERNSLMATQAFLARVPIPATNVHPIPAQSGPAVAALDYERTILEHARLPFDLVLLGMGEDGHTASLFPGHPIPEDRLVIPVLGSPKPPAERVSLTPRALAETRAMLILVTGAEKAAAYAAWRAGADLPVARVAALGAALVLVDRTAAGTAEPAAPPLRSSFMPPPAT
jgi:6-phosphogluconolactonase